MLCVQIGAAAAAAATNNETQWDSRVKYNNEMVRARSNK